MIRTMEELWDLMSLYDANNDELISTLELGKLLLDKHTVKVLKSIDVDLDGLVNVAEFFFEEHGGSMTKPEFKRMVLDMRSKNPAKVKDHVETRKFLASYMKQMGMSRSQGCNPIPPFR